MKINNPFLEWLGTKLVRFQDGYAEMRLGYEPNFCNRTGRIQGGVICTLIDASAGYSGLFNLSGAPHRNSVTLSLTTNFIKTCNGTVLTAKGYMQHRGNGIYFARGEVWMDEKELLATGVGTFKYLRID